MILSTTDTIPGKQVNRVLGIAKGNTIRARHIGKDILALFKTIVGGEIEEYTKLIAEAREQALDRMIANARELGADAVINVRFSTSYIMGTASEILAYGTAVKLG
ncbi:MAG: YbjQ family protein [Calditrichaeota bacterium]|nr:MAG: YbjQ family protein [Calditrichota bacterium]